MGTGKFYAVRKGRKPGIYSSWAECEQQVKGYSESEYKSFQSLAEAEAYQNDSQQHGCPPRKRPFSANSWGASAEAPLRDTSGSAQQSCQERASSAVLATAVGPATRDQDGTFQLEFDGASKGNPGPAGGGALLRRPDGTPMLAVKVGAGSTTNNVAEYRGLIEGLRVAQGRGVEKIRVQGDSKLVSEQVQGRWQVSTDHLLPLCEEARQLAKGFREFCIRNIPRALNPVADQLANQAIVLSANEVAVVEEEALSASVGHLLGGADAQPLQRKRPRTRYSLWGGGDRWQGSPLQWGRQRQGPALPAAYCPGFHRGFSRRRGDLEWGRAPRQLATAPPPSLGPVLQARLGGVPRQQRAEAGGARTRASLRTPALLSGQGRSRHRGGREELAGQPEPAQPVATSVAGPRLLHLRHLAGAAFAARPQPGRPLLLLGGAVATNGLGRVLGQAIRLGACAQLTFC